MEQVKVRWAKHTSEMLLTKTASQPQLDRDAPGGVLELQKLHPFCVNEFIETYDEVINLSPSVYLSTGALHQSKCEEECLSEHAESGRPAQRVFHHLLRNTHLHTHPASSSPLTDIP